LVTANAYMGCSGIVQALDAGADLVITGRVADPSMVVGACVHAFGWSFDDWNRLAGATVAGHLLECGTHVTGGIATDWMAVPDAERIGFPIAEIDDDGGCVITKPPSSGGCVSMETVKEQLVYEIGDPSSYISPDVVVSFQNLKVNPLAKDRVEVRGALGFECPTQLKVSATYRDGYRSAGMLTIFGSNAAAKAERCGGIVLQRLSDAGWEYRDTIVETLGQGGSVPVLRAQSSDSGSIETVLRIAVESKSKEAVDAFTREMIPLVTAGPQGTTGYAEGRPRVHTVFRYWPCLIELGRVVPKVDCIVSDTSPLQGRESPVWPPKPRTDGQPRSNGKPRGPLPAIGMIGIECPPCGLLLDVAYGRSGDKGTGANIGILARSEGIFGALTEWLTEERVASFFSPMGLESVTRYILPNLHGFNFVVRGILKRGLRNDAQGKALAQALLQMPLTDFPIDTVVT
jgi:hypothetical protein